MSIKLSEIPSWFRKLPAGQAIVKELEAKDAERSDRLALVRDYREAMLALAAFHAKHGSDVPNAEVTCQAAIVAAQQELQQAHEAYQRALGPLEARERGLREALMAHTPYPTEWLREQIGRIHAHVYEHQRWDHSHLRDAIRAREAGVRANGGYGNSEEELAKAKRDLQAAEHSDQMLVTLRTLIDEINNVALEEDPERTLRAIEARLPEQCACGYRYPDDRRIAA